MGTGIHHLIIALLKELATEDQKEHATEDQKEHATEGTKVTANHVSASTQTQETCQCMTLVNEPQQQQQQQIGGAPVRATGVSPWKTWEQTIEELMQKKKIKRK